MKIGILGAGTWGIALANLLCISGHDVSVWSALPEEIEILESTHIHPKFPDTVLPEKMSFTTDIQKVCSENYILVVAVPSVFIRSTSRTISPFLKNGQIIVSVAKGIEESTLMSMTEVIANELGDIVREKSINIAALSGPTHAEEVIRLCEEPSDFTFSYELDQSIEKKLNDIVTKVYGGKRAVLTATAQKQAKELEALGYGGMPICVAKTQYSLTDDPTKLGRPQKFNITVRDITVSAGAGFLVALTGDIMKMPGLPKQPAALKIDVDNTGKISGLF